MSYLPICHLCEKPVKLETAKTDELGRTVHEGCYVLHVSLRKATILPKK